MTNTYRVEVPLRLSVEADSLTEANEALLRLWQECCECLPTGASAFEKEHVAKAFLASHAKSA